MAPTSTRMLWSRSQDVSQLPSTPLQQAMIAVMITLTALAFLVHCSRLYIRIQTKQLGLDDHLMTLAVIIACALAGPTYMYFKLAYAGFPKDEVATFTLDMEAAMRWNYVMQVLYNPILCLVKASVLVFLLRIAGQKKSVRMSIHVLNAVNLGLMISIFFCVLFQTLPIESFWDATVPATHRINGGQFYVATAVITVVTDIFVLCIPVWILGGLKMHKSTKIGLIIIFLISGLVTVMGIVRIYAFNRATSDPEFDFNNSWAPAFSQIEVTLGIISASIPALRPLFAKMLPGLFTRKSTTDAAQYDYRGRSAYGLGTNGRKTFTSNSFPLKSIGHTHTEIGEHSSGPNESEEELMTYNGIMRTTKVTVVHGPQSDDKQ